MGKGAYMTIVNGSSQNVELGISNVQCMYEDHFPPLQKFLPTGQSIVSAYIEAKASGSCAFENSHFTLDVTSNSGSVGMKFTESGNTWSVDSTKVIGAGLQVTGASQVAGDQYQIVVTVTNAP